MFTFLMSSEYDADAKAHFARMTSVDSKLKFDLNTLISGLKLDDLWDKINCLCVVHGLEADSLLNLKGNGTYADSTTSGSPTFAADRGFTFASGKYIDTNQASNALFVDSTKAHMFGYSRTSWPQYTTRSANIITADRCSITLFGSVSLSDHESRNTICNNIGNVLDYTGDGELKGFIGASKESSTVHATRINDTTGALFDGHIAPTDTATAKVGQNSAIQIAAWGYGSDLTSAQLGLYEDRIRAFMQARGADVY